MNKLVVISGPSGSGKSTLIDRLLKEHPDQFGFSISHTTRMPRSGEENGKHYHFVSKEEMEAMVKDGKFIETASYSGNMYGTSYESVMKVLDEDKACVLDVDIEGVKQIRQRGDFDPIFVFVKPPSLRTLRDRLLRRGETEASAERRLSFAEGEIQYGEIEGNFNLVIVNEDVQKSYETLESFVLDELYRRGANLPNLKPPKIQRN